MFGREKARIFLKYEHRDFKIKVNNFLKTSKFQTTKYKITKKLFSTYHFCPGIFLCIKPGVLSWNVPTFYWDLWGPAEGRLPKKSRLLFLFTFFLAYCHARAHLYDFIRRWVGNISVDENVLNCFFYLIIVSVPIWSSIIASVGPKPRYLQKTEKLLDFSKIK